MQVTATANDTTSGVGSLESSLDGGVYQAYNSPVSFVDGYHTVQFKAVDKAGNETETSAQEFYVDTIAPAVDLPAEWEVNDTITYKVQDDGSGLSGLRIVIEDEDEKFAKVAWDEAVSGDKFKGEITWNGKFKDGTIAPPGEYLVWVKAKDWAGNERFGLGRVIVPAPTSFFAPFSSPTVNNEETPLPPEELFDEGDSIVVTTTPQASFGGATVATQEAAQSSLSLVTGTASASTAPNSNILWGAAAAAMLGATMAYALEEKKKRKEQEQAQISEISLQREKAKTRANRDEEPPMTRQEKELAKQRKGLQKIWDANGAAIYEANREYKAKHGKEMAAAARSKAIKDATMNGVFNAGAYASNLEAEKTRRDAQNERMANKMTRVEKEEEVRWQEQQKAAEEKRKTEELQAGYAAYYSAMRQGKKESQLKTEKEKPWWQKAWDIAKTFVQEKIVEPVTTIWNEKVYEPYIQPAVKWSQENIIQPAKTFWEEKVDKPYIQPVTTWISRNIVEPVKTVFRENPKAVWGTAAVVTTATIAGTVYYIDCFGMPSFTPPVSSLINLAGMFSLPLTGLLTTNKKQRLYGILVGMLMLGMFLSACGTGNVPSAPTTTPTLCPTETPTTVPSTAIATPEWMNLTPTSIETNLQLFQLQAWLAANGLPSDWDSVYRWQNQFDPIILQIAMDRNIPPMLLKALFGHEGQFIPLPDNSIRPDALGIGQILPSGIDTVFNFGDPIATQKWMEMNYAFVVSAGDVNKMVDKNGNVLDPSIIGYQSFYQQLSPDAQTLFRGYFLGFINNKCDYREAVNGQCVEGGVNIAEVSVNFEFSADVLMAGDNAISQYLLANNQAQLWNTFWNNLPDEEKWKVRVATYNSGQGCIGDAIIATGGQADSWTDIAEQLGSGCTQGADEVNGVWNILK